MSLSNTEIARQGGRFNAALGMLLTTDDITKMGEMHLQTLLHFLMLVYYDDDLKTPLSGFPRAFLNSTNADIAGTGDLTFDISPGWGLVYDASQLGGDEFGSPAYQMVVLDALMGGALGAHHATLPRVDLIALKPVRVDDQPATRNIKDPSTGALSTSSVNLRTRLAAELVIIPGTPSATPVDPVLPNGHLLVGRAEVPATAGATSFRDARPLLVEGTLMKGPPGAPAYLVDHVYPIGVGSELTVAETAPVSTSAEVSPGRAVIEGVPRYYPRISLAFAAGDPVDPRIDLVVANQSGALVVVAGVPAPAPVAPAVPAKAVPLAEVLMPALATNVITANITDRRVRTWLDGDLALRLGSLSTQLLIQPAVVVAVVGTSSPDPDVRRVDFRAEHPDGSVWDGALPDVLVEIYEVDPAFSISALGVFTNTSGADRRMIGDHMLLYDAAGVSDFALFPDNGIDNQGAVDGGQAATAGVQNGRMRGSLTNVDFALEWCRNTTAGSPAIEVYMVVTPVGPSDGLPIGPRAIQRLAFV